jgi:hypothetical protein
MGPTGTAVIVGCDPASTVLEDCYAEEAQPLPNAEDVLGEVAYCAAT